MLLISTSKYLTNQTNITESKTGVIRKIGARSMNDIDLDVLSCKKCLLLKIKNDVQREGKEMVLMEGRLVGKLVA